MAPSRTETEQAVAERPEARGRAMDFATSSDVSADDVSVTETKRDSKTSTRARSTSSTDRVARRAADRIRQGHAARPLPAARRDLPGSVRPRRLGLCRRPGPRPAGLRLYLEAVVHAGDAGAVERRHRPRPADLLLSEQRRRQPRRHRRHLERECLAGLQRRRHRHLLGQRARHRRAGRPQRQDQRHHPLRPGDGHR